MALFDLLRDGLHEGAAIPRDEAERLAVAILQYGSAAGVAGSRIYWPANVRTMTAAELEAAVRADQGRPVREICEKYSISHTTAYKILSG
jgi:hypothetical protein